MGSNVWEHVRVLNGVPKTGAELTEAVNPLEAGLYASVSLAKGCYIGQETLAKVYNNNGAAFPAAPCQTGIIDPVTPSVQHLMRLRARCAGVKQQLWGLRLRAGCTCAVGDIVEDTGGRRLGSVTSITAIGGGMHALAYLKCKEGGAQVSLEGIQVLVNSIPAKVSHHTL